MGKSKGNPVHLSKDPLQCRRALRRSTEQREKSRRASREDELTPMSIEDSFLRMLHHLVEDSPEYFESKKKELRSRVCVPPRETRVID